MIDKGCNNLKDVAQIDSDIRTNSQINNDCKTDTNITNTFDNITEIIQKYTGKDSKDIEVIVNNEEMTISAKNKKKQYDSKNLFPNVGSDGLEYYAIDECATYIWIEEELRYKCVGRDYEEIEQIFGGNA